MTVALAVAGSLRGLLYGVAPIDTDHRDRGGVADDDRRDRGGQRSRLARRSRRSHDRLTRRIEFE